MVPASRLSLLDSWAIRRHGAGCLVVTQIHWVDEAEYPHVIDVLRKNRAASV